MVEWSINRIIGDKEIEESAGKLQPGNNHPHWFHQKWLRCYFTSPAFWLQDIKVSLRPLRPPTSTFLHFSAPYHSWKSDVDKAAGSLWWPWKNGSSTTKISCFSRDRYGFVCSHSRQQVVIQTRLPEATCDISSTFVAPTSSRSWIKAENHFFLLVWPLKNISGVPQPCYFHSPPGYYFSASRKTYPLSSLTTMMDSAPFSHILQWAQFLPLHYQQRPHSLRLLVHLTQVIVTWVIFLLFIFWPDHQSKSPHSWLLNHTTVWYGSTPDFQ